MKEVTEGMKKYLSLLRLICNEENLQDLPEKEWEGAIGVSCVMSVLEGIKPSIFDLSKHLGINHTNRNFYNAFKRLKLNGIFNKDYDLVNDECLLGRSKDTKWKSSSKRNLFAWCNIAGVAGGFIGLKDKE